MKKDQFLLKYNKLASKTDYFFPQNEELYIRGYGRNQNPRKSAILPRLFFFLLAITGIRLKIIRPLRSVTARFNSFLVKFLGPHYPANAIMAVQIFQGFS